MSAPFRPAARTRTRNSPAPGSGSGWSSTVSCLSRIVTARIAASAAYPWRAVGDPLPAVQHGHTLDVRRLREHVDRTYPLELVAGLDQLRRVGRQRGGVA